MWVVFWSCRICLIWWAGKVSSQIQEVTWWMQDYHGEKLRCTDRGCIQVGCNISIFYIALLTLWATAGPHRINLDFICSLLPPFLITPSPSHHTLIMILIPPQLPRGHPHWGFPIPPSTTPPISPVIIPSDHFYPKTTQNTHKISKNTKMTATKFLARTPQRHPRMHPKCLKT